MTWIPPSLKYPLGADVYTYTAKPQPSKTSPKVTQQKKGIYPQSLSQRDMMDRAMTSAYTNAKNSGQLGTGFGGIAPKKPQTPLQKQKVNPGALTGALQAKKR